MAQTEDRRIDGIIEEWTGKGSQQLSVKELADVANQLLQAASAVLKRIEEYDADPKDPRAVWLDTGEFADEAGFTLGETGRTIYGVDGKRIGWFDEDDFAHYEQ